MSRRHPSLADAVEDVFFGSANQAGEDNRNLARMALLLAGLPEIRSGRDGQPPVRLGHGGGRAAARAIKAGEISLAIAGGSESMTRAPLVMGKAETAFQRSAEVYDTTIGWRFVNPLMKKLYGVDSMPETAQNVADELGCRAKTRTRSRCARRSARPPRRGRGVFEAEIVAVEIKDRKGATTRVRQRRAPPRRHDARGARKTPRHRAPGRQRHRRQRVRRQRRRVGACPRIGDVRAAQGPYADRARLGYATAGVAPRMMGVGPVPAVKRLCERLSLKPADST